MHLQFPRFNKKKMPALTKTFSIRPTLHLVFSFSSSHHPNSFSPPPSTNPLSTLNTLLHSTSSFPPKFYNSTLAALSANFPIEHAHHLFNTMRHRNIEFDNVGFGCFLKRVCCSVELRKILFMVQEVRDMGHRINGSVVALLIVDGLCRAGKIEDAWDALEELRLIGWKPDFVAYRVVSEGFRLADRLEEQGRILKQKRKLGVAPRVSDYGEFILWLISEKRVQEAKELGEAIVYGDFPIDDDVLESLICSVSDVDTESSVVLLKYIVNKDRFPSIELVRYVSRNVCKKGNGDGMLAVYRILCDKGFCCEVEHYNLMVSFLCGVGKLREAYDVFKAMKKEGCDPDVNSYNILMEACCRDDLLRPAKKLWDEMFANGCSANLTTYNILIGKFLEVGEIEEAKHLFSHMIGKGVVPNELTYSMLIRVICEAKNVEGAIEIFNKSLEQDVVLANSTLSVLILALCKEGNYDAASRIMETLPSHVESSSGLHVILLKSLTDAGEVQMAIKHTEWLKNNSPLRLQTILSELITSLSTAPNLDPVIKLLRLMRVKGLVSETDPWMKLLEEF